MADPSSIPLTLSALKALSGKIYEQIAEFLGHARDPPAGAKEVLAELYTLGFIIGQLEGNFVREVQLPPDATRDLAVVLDSCEKDLLHLQTIAQRFVDSEKDSTIAAVWKTWRLLFADKDLSRTRSALERHKATLNMTLLLTNSLSMGQVPLIPQPQSQTPYHEPSQYQAPQYQAPQYQTPDYQSPQYQAPIAPQFQAKTPGVPGWANNWKEIGGPFPSDCSIAVAANGPSEIDIVACDTDGQTRCSWWVEGEEGWSSHGDKWKLLRGPFAPGTKLSVVARRNTHSNVDVFGCDRNGRVWTIWKHKDSDISHLAENWRPLGGIFPPGAEVTAVARTPDILDIFVCGIDGRVYTSWWVQGQDWSGVNDNWRPIGGFFLPGTKVAAVARKPHILDLFVCGHDGRVYNSYWVHGRDWSGINNNWRSIGGSFPPGAPLTAVARTPINLDVFICGSDARIYTTSWYGEGNEWPGNWHSIGGLSPPGAEVAVVSRTADRLDIFVPGRDGIIYTSWWSEGTGWFDGESWPLIGGNHPPSSSVAAVARTPTNLNVFICGTDGRIYASSWSAE